jgi:hypothetical protein
MNVEINKSIAKTFDCLEFKYKAQERIYKIIKDFSPEEERNILTIMQKKDLFKDFIVSMHESSS